jgi:hypothetical protein
MTPTITEKNVLIALSEPHSFRTLVRVFRASTIRLENRLQLIVDKLIHQEKVTKFSGHSIAGKSMSIELCEEFGLSAFEFNFITSANMEVVANEV